MQALQHPKPARALLLSIGNARTAPRLCRGQSAGTDIAQGPVGAGQVDSLVHVLPSQCWTLHPCMCPIRQLLHVRAREDGPCREAGWTPALPCSWQLMGSCHQLRQLLGARFPPVGLLLPGRVPGATCSTESSLHLSRAVTFMTLEAARSQRQQKACRGLLRGPLYCMCRWSGPCGSVGALGALADSASRCRKQPAPSGNTGRS